MFDTFPLHPALFRMAELAMRGLRAGLLIAGIIFIFGLSHLTAGNPRLGEWLRPYLDSPVAEEVSPSLPETDAAGLTPRMQLALDFAARRYRVSPEALQPVFAVAEAAASEFRLDPLLVVAVIAIESRFNPFAESVVGAQGLMQVIPRFHKEKLPADAGDLPLFDPQINVRVGTQTLHEYIRRQGGVIPGLQQYAGAADDPAQGYASKVLAEKQRLEEAVRRRIGSQV